MTAIRSRIVDFDNMKKISHLYWRQGLCLQLRVHARSQVTKLDENHSGKCSTVGGAARYPETRHHSKRERFSHSHDTSSCHQSRRAG